MKQNHSDVSKKNDAFWEREAQANFARKQDISSLPYLTVPNDALPFGTPLDETEEDLQNQVRECSRRKMLNLSGYSNTDLKEKYGPTNLEELSACDQNFLSFIRALNNWGKYLYEQEEYDRSRQIMEYSLSIGSDISSVFVTLGNIYAREQQLEEVDKLITLVQNSDISLKDSVIRQLRLCKLEY
ncbi:MAG: hypothetical protein PUH02_05030 [bacterium]|nr:hypothetical protein [bacterium]